MKELEIPSSALEHDDAIEFVRMWVAGGEDHVALYIGGMGDQEAKQWGMILADISVHIIRGLLQDGAKETPEMLRAMIEKAYVDRLNNRDDVKITGSLLGTRQ